MTMNTSLMPLKVSYTFHDESQTFLCKPQGLLKIKHGELQLDDKTVQIGVVKLEECMESILKASPEIMNNIQSGNFDYNVYVRDHSEASSPLVGYGLITKLLNDKFSEGTKEILIPGLVEPSFSIYNKGTAESNLSLMVTIRLKKIENKNTFRVMKKPASMAKAMRNTNNNTNNIRAMKATRTLSLPCKPFASENNQCQILNYDYNGLIPNLGTIKTASNKTKASSKATANAGGAAAKGTKRKFGTVLSNSAVSGTANKRTKMERKVLQEYADKSYLNQSMLMNTLYTTAKPKEKITATAQQSDYNNLMGNKENILPDILEFLNSSASATSAGHPSSNTYSGYSSDDTGRNLSKELDQLLTSDDKQVETSSIHEDDGRTPKDLASELENEQIHCSDEEYKMKLVSSPFVMFD